MQRKKAKIAVENASRKEKKKIQMAWDERLAWLDGILAVATEAEWLYEKFAEGEYEDVLGLCKIASREEIREKDRSLTPGAYVGVAEIEDDGVDFAMRMKAIQQELLNLQRESNALMNTVVQNLMELEL